MKTRYIILTVIIAFSLVSIQLVNANVSSIVTTFQKPNLKLELNNNTVIIPDNVGQINKQYNHEDFNTLLQEEISKAEKIRDKLVNTQTRDF